MKKIIILISVVALTVLASCGAKTETPTVNVEAPTVNVEAPVAPAPVAPTVNVEAPVAPAPVAPTVNVEAPAAVMDKMEDKAMPEAPAAQ